MFGKIKKPLTFALPSKRGGREKSEKIFERRKQQN